MNNTKHLGYACINLSLGKDVSSNRGMIKKTFQEKGKSYASELALLNTRDLIKIMEWNRDNDIDFYRISSDVFPWMSEYEITTMPDWVEIKNNLQQFGNIARQNNIRIEFHPGQYVVLCSPKEEVVTNAINDIEKHSQILDAMGYDADFNTAINIHVGATYGDKLSAAKSWCQRWNLLSDRAKRRLVVENDDKQNMYSVKDLYELIHKEVGTPITFDHFHHIHCTGDLDAYDAAHLAATTWPSTSKPAQHYSSSRKINEDPTAKAQAHADWIYEKIDRYVQDSWVMVESKMKDLAILKYMEQFS
jgi:UV DNA damage endonuclease